jgi:hypothetical protein
MKTSSLLVNGALHSAIAGANSFPALAGIAIQYYFEVNGGIVHFTSGPVSTGGVGNKEGNLHRLSHVSRKLAEMYGFTMFDHPIWETQLKILADRWLAEGNSGYCWPIMREFYETVFRSKLMKVQMLWLLPDWKSSTGSQDEKRICDELGIPIRLLSPAIFSDLPQLALAKS